MDLSDSEIRQEICKVDFIDKLQKSFELCNGGSFELFKKMTGQEIVDIFAVNGLRMIYIKDCHSDSITDNQIKLVRLGINLANEPK